MSGGSSGIERMTFDEYLDSIPKESMPDGVSGQAVRFLPNTFEQLLEVIGETSNPKCVVQPEIDAMVEMIGMSQDPDSLVRQLPYDPEPDGKLFIMFVLPRNSD